MAEAEEKPMSNIEECGECASSIFWAVFLTLMVVFAAMLIVYFFWKYYWRIKHGKHLVLVTDVEKGEPEFAFDNPGFREGTPVIQARTVSAEIKEKAELKDNSQKLSNGHKPQSLEDGALNKSGASTSSDQKTNVIPLKSKDFTGLGFDICGNMRDGIYVKDLLHRGPASETGMIKQGDRISAIRINFSHMVYEDAKAILSYASPYEVEIEVEDGSINANAAKSSSPNSTHSFYRSQSFSTAQQIQKIIPRKLNFNSTDKKPDQPSDTKPAILEVSEISDKMFKYGVKVLPDIKSKVLSQTSSPAVITNETQHHANVSATVIDIQSDSGIDTKTPTTSFDEVDLSPPVSQSQPHEKPTAGTSLTSTFKDNNMKTKLVKGIQNLKDKLNNHIQKSATKESSEMQKIEKMPDQQSSSPSPKPNSSVSSVESVEQNHKPQEDINLRLRSSSISSNEDAAKKSKRKAPLPPVVLPDVEFNLLNEIENEVNKNNYECKDSDSEAEPDMNTIELNSSHITVHHIPEESSRKAASLGDLSKITETDSPVPLERAVSLELTEHTPRGSKKRKAPLPPEENLSSEELFAKDSKSDLGLTKLKKSSLFGTLEEAVKTKDDDSIASDSDMLTSSTPMKLPDDDNKFLSIESNCSNISWELNFDLQDESNVFADIDEKVPDLPTSPMPNPNLPTYVTEIKVSNGDDDNDLSKVNISDLTLFVTAAEINENDKTAEEADDSKTSELIETKTMVDTSPSSTDSTSTNDYENEDSSLDTVKEMSYTNGIGGEDHSPKDSPVESSKTSNQKSFSKFSKENMSDEQILALNSSNSTTPNLKYSKIKSPGSTNKLPKLSQSVSPVKAAGSRIPIRANTEPSLKVSLINKDDIVVPKPRKYKLSEDASLENGKPVTFASSNHLPSPTHKTSVLSETRHNGPNR